MSPPHFHWTGTGLSHQGMVRTSNQDAFAIDNDHGLWIVADGMGGYTGGQVASALATTAIMDHVRAVPATAPQEADRLSQATAMLSHAIATAKTAIQDRITKEPDLRSMGTTVVTAWFLPDPVPSMAIAHLGDSRAYRIRDAHLELITTDHSLVQQLVAEGHITPDQAHDHPKRNVITRALGLSFPSTPDIAVHPLNPEDVILLCTDGLTKTLTDQDILAVILEFRNTPEKACQRLIDCANAAGGIDNTTALLITPSRPPSS
ncbi:MAG: Stp1/IreP family PP2C-type Ser/Thr phosphatase [Nitrospira sp.]|nr:Stp1/IreP family PP2C-type Ser/Thr phosphatase [Nitrospira sp.]